MKTKKSIGLYLLLAAAVVTVIGLILYGSVFAKSGSVNTYLILSLVAAAAAVGISFTAIPELPNLAAGLTTVLLFVGFCVSIAPMVTPIAYWYAGLYDYSTVSAYFTFAVVWAVAWILALVSSFTGIVKKAN